MTYNVFSWTLNPAQSQSQPSPVRPPVGRPCCLVIFARALQLQLNDVSWLRWRHLLFTHSHRPTMAVTKLIRLLTWLLYKSVHGAIAGTHRLACINIKYQTKIWIDEFKPRMWKIIKFNNTIMITFHMRPRHSRDKIYIGYGRLCVWLSCVCLSVCCPSPHSHTTVQTQM